MSAAGVALAPEPESKIQRLCPKHELPVEEIPDDDRHMRCPGASGYHGNGRPHVIDRWMVADLETRRIITGANRRRRYMVLREHPARVRAAERAIDVASRTSRCDAALRRYNGNVQSAARSMGVTRETLYRWVQAGGLDLTAYRSGQLLPEANPEDLPPPTAVEFAVDLGPVLERLDRLERMLQRLLGEEVVP